MATPSTAIARFELGSTFAEFDIRMNQLGYIGAQVLRPRVVGVPSASIGKIPLKHLLANANDTTRRAPGSGYARDKFEFDQFSYAIKEYGKESPLDDAEQAIYGDIVDGEQISADRAADSVLNEYERDAAAAVFNTTTWTGSSLTTAAGTAFSNFATATPCAVIQAACEKVAAGSGLEPNAVIMNKGDWRNLIQCDEIVDKLKFTVTPTIDKIKAAVAEILGIPRIIVAGGFKNTANEGQAASISRIWSAGKMMVCRVAETDDPREPCIGRTFIWPGDGPSAPGDGGTLAVIAEEYREEGIRGTVFRARNNRDIVVMYAQAGHLVTGI